MAWFTFGNGIVYDWAWFALLLVVVKFELRLVWSIVRAGMASMRGPIGFMLGVVCLTFERGLLVCVWEMASFHSRVVWSMFGKCLLVASAVGTA